MSYKIVLTIINVNKFTNICHLLRVENNSIERYNTLEKRIKEMEKQISGKF